MKRIYIVGGNGFARECYVNIMNIAAADNSIVFGGFIGHNGYKVDFGSLSSYFVGDLSEVSLGENDYCVIGAGYPELRKKIYEDLKKKNAKFYTLVTKEETMNEFIEIGEGNIFLHSFPSPNVKIGNGNLFNHQVIIAHDVEIGDFNFFGPRSQILGNVKVGNCNKVGANAVLLPQAKIGSCNDIAPLSAVYKGCKDNCYMVGNPALKIGEVSND